MDYNTDIVDAPIHEPNSDYHYSEGSYFPPQFKIVAVFLAIAGLILCINLNLIGFVLLPLSIAILFAKKELTISFSLSKYKHAIKIFKFKFGAWEPMPKVEYISIFSGKKRQDVAVGPMTTSTAYNEMEVNLVYNKSKRLTVFETSDFAKAFRIAQSFATQLDLKIYDATKREGEWLT